jgi:hypothetical protein
VTEMLAACAFNSIANGVGQFSFTHALNEKLRLMAGLPGFTIGYLYNAVFSYIQNWRLEEARFKKPPVHLVLSQNPKLPRSIRLAKVSKSALNNGNKILQSSYLAPGQDSLAPNSAASGPIQSSVLSNASDGQASMSNDATPGKSLPSENQLSDWPRLLLSIRFSENVKPGELSTELFGEWLRSIPALANAVKIEAGFASDSTLMLVSIPTGLLGHLARDPAIVLIGTIRSRNLLTTLPHQGQISAMNANLQDDTGKSAPRNSKNSDREVVPSLTPRMESKSAFGKTESTFRLPSEHQIYGDLGSPFQEYEKRLMMAEALRVSSIPLDDIFEFFQQKTTDLPNWDHMLLPRGRTLNQCKAAYDSLGPGITSSSLHKPNPKTFSSFSSIFSEMPIPHKRKSDAAISSGARDIRPKPPKAGLHSPIIPQKRRGRPPKAEVERRQREAIAREETFPSPTQIGYQSTSSPTPAKHRGNIDSKTYEDKYGLDNQE